MTQDQELETLRAREQALLAELAAVRTANAELRLQVRELRDEHDRFNKFEAAVRQALERQSAPTL
jgi:hypothetical protein